MDTCFLAECLLEPPSWGAGGAGLGIRGWVLGF